MSNQRAIRTGTHRISFLKCLSDRPYGKFVILRFSIFLTVISSLYGDPPPLQTFTLKEYLNHFWQNELVHFPVDTTTSEKNLSLTDAKEHFLPCQFTDLKWDGDHLTGNVWTVVSLEPGSEEVFNLVPAAAISPPQKAAPTLSISQEGKYIVLANEYLAVRIPNWTGLVKGSTNLTQLPAPWESVSRKTNLWLGNARWINDGPPLSVKEASTQVIEQGPVRVIVRQSLTFTDGNVYNATIELALRQDAALIKEDSNLDAPKAGISFSMQAGLKADHVFWYNQEAKGNRASNYLTDTPLEFHKQQVICKLRPWSFWWLGDITVWAGFYQKGADNFVGMIPLHPSHWSPTRWDGFDRTEIPIVAGPDGKVDLTFKLVATKNKDKSGVQTEMPLHREWALTAGTVKDHVFVDGKTTPKLRRQLIQFSEFPLDDVKDYSFDFTAAKPNQVHPCLILTRDDVERVRRQAHTVPSVKAETEAAIRYIIAQCHADATLKKEGWKPFYTKNYVGNSLVEKLPEAYLGSNDPIFGQMMAAAVKGLSRSLLDTFLERPSRPSLGAYGPWISKDILRVLLNYDFIARARFLTPEEELIVRNSLVLAAQVLSHPDYWNPDRGLASANPNMANSIILPQGLLGLYLAGHPQANDWLKASERELNSELRDWISPGGAWIESPGYQAVSLDGIFLLSQAIRNVQGRDYFGDPQFRAMMNYYGFLLTPPDRRFPPRPRPNMPSAPMTLPSVGDTFAGWITCFNGWMAKATAETDPAYSAQQQFYWKAQNYYLGGTERATGITMAVTNPELPEKAPPELSHSFPGFGSVLRTSWTQNNATYVCHRTGPTLHHYHDDFNSIVLYAKGAPLCLDFGNFYQPLQRNEPWYHNRVSFSKKPSPQYGGSSGELVEMRSLPPVIDYSYGKSWGGLGQEDQRHILLIKSTNPLGANYVVIRDTTVSRQSNQEFYWNLFCLSKDPTIKGDLVHFPGQLGVDLDVYMLSPATPKIEKDHWNWKQQIYVWNDFSEEQYGMRVAKSSAEDFFSVLYPRARGQAAAKVVRWQDGSGLSVSHIEGIDLVLLSPGKPAKFGDATMSVRGKIAFARKATDGSLRLAVIKGSNNESEAAIGDWHLESCSPVSLFIRGNSVSGESAGDSHLARITLPPRFPDAILSLDGNPSEASRQGREMTVNLPAGNHTFTIQPK